MSKLSSNESKASSQRQRAGALMQICAQLAGDPGHIARAQELGSVEATDADREAAANEIYSLAQRREHAGTTANALAAPKPGWIKGGDDFGLLLHQPDRLREAIEFYGIALTLHDEPFWSYTKGLLQERLGDFAGAISTFETTPGSYGAYALPHIDRCRKKLAGTYDAEAALDKAFGSLTEKMQSANDDSGLLKSTLNRLGNWFRKPRPGSIHKPNVASEPVLTNQAEPDDATHDDDSAALLAQTFAEALVDGDYCGAHAMLALDLKHLRADDLRTSYEQMIDLSEDEVEHVGEANGEIQVCVMSSDGDMPDMRPDDIAYVYVAISGAEFNEAVYVLVAREDATLRIREIDWGRP